MDPPIFIFSCYSDGEQAIRDPHYGSAIVCTNVVCTVAAASLIYLHKDNHRFTFRGNMLPQDRVRSQMKKANSLVFSYLVFVS